MFFSRMVHKRMVHCLYGHNNLIYASVPGLPCLVFLMITFVMGALFLDIVILFVIYRRFQVPKQVFPSIRTR